MGVQLCLNPSISIRMFSSGRYERIEYYGSLNPSISIRMFSSRFEFQLCNG